MLELYLSIELGSLDKTLIILGETLISLERGNPKSKVIFLLLFFLILNEETKNFKMEEKSVK